MATRLLGRWKLLFPLVIFPLVAIMSIAKGMVVHGESRNSTSPSILDQNLNHAVKNTGFIEISSSDSSDTVSCRNGVVAIGAEQVGWVDDLGAGLYVYFGGFSETAGNGAESIPLIHVHQEKDANGNYLDEYTTTPALTEESLGVLLTFYPGRLWMIGNEVDRGPNPGGVGVGQGDMYPQVYARAYHDAYQFIKARDPSAQVAISGLVEVTPGRLQYLELVWDTFRELYGNAMPVDVWNMHLYILPEVLPSGEPNGIANVALGTDPGLGIRESGNNPALCSLSNVYCYAEHDDINEFDVQVRAMRRWMLNHGQREKPLILSEYSIIYPYIVDEGGCYLQDEYGECFTQSRVMQFLDNTMSYFNSAVDPVIGNPLDDDRLIQQTAWFSINNDGTVGDVSNLVEKDNPSGPLTRLSPIGGKFNDYMQLEPLYVNLVPDQMDSIAAFTVGQGSTTSVTLQVDLANNGTIPVTEPFTVSFYEDISPKKEIASVVVSSSMMPEGMLPGCVRRTVKVSVEWSGLSPGIHPFWVEIDSANQIEELTPGGSGEEDNLAMALVLVDQARAHLPFISLSYGQSQ